MSGTTLSRDSDKTFDYRGVIDRYYPEGTPLRPVYLTHCGQVAGLALDIARSRGLSLDRADIEAAAMLHDIGIFACDAPSIGCHGTAPYIMHGVSRRRPAAPRGRPRALCPCGRAPYRLGHRHRRGPFGSASPPGAPTCLKPSLSSLCVMPTSSSRSRATCAASRLTACASQWPGSARPHWLVSTSWPPVSAPGSQYPSLP